jgi:hypothetical protein
LLSSTMPPEIVEATLTDRKAPTTLSTPAIATANLGFSAPVAIEVAIAFAVSWKPLVKSKANAVRTTMTTIRGTLTGHLRLGTSRAP